MLSLMRPSITELATLLRDADKELAVFEDDAVCDHSVGICWCSYQRVRERLKAAAAQMETALTQDGGGGMSAPVDVLAVLRAAVGDAVMARAARFKPEHAIKLEREGFAAVEAVAELIAELSAAHRIIRIALNTLPPAAKREFLAQVVEAGLDGEGITRANEREALLARCGGAP